MLYAGLFQVPEDALQLYAVRRGPPNMRAAELRYLYYLTTILSQSNSLKPHYKPVLFVSLSLQPVPLFTKVRDGCRPYVEIYSGERCILSTMKEYERMRVFNIAEGKVRYAQKYSATWNGKMLSKAYRIQFATLCG